MIYETLHRHLTIEQHNPHKNPGMNTDLGLHISPCYQTMQDDVQCNKLYIILRVVNDNDL